MEIPVTIIQDIFAAVVDGDQANTDHLVEQALADGIAPRVLLGEALIAGMSEVGNRFQVGEYFVPDMLVSARAMKAGMARLRPYLVTEDIQPIGKVVIGTVQGDLHDIGKNLVAMMLEGAGFQVTDLGVNVSPERFVETAQEQGADLIALSALLTTTMGSMQSVVTAVKQAGLQGRVKVLIGGAPIRQEYADQIGADGFAPDASLAAACARSLVGV
jgi:5-methyltetrahydrofolate--homocysteine methyltransferase